MGKRKVIENCFLWCYTCSCLCVDLGGVFNNCFKKKTKKNCLFFLFPPLVPFTFLNIPALSLSFLDLYVKFNSLLSQIQCSSDQNRWKKKETKGGNVKRGGHFAVFKHYVDNQTDEGINKRATPPQSSIGKQIVQRALAYSTFILFFLFIEVSKSPFMPGNFFFLATVRSSRSSHFPCCS